MKNIEQIEVCKGEIMLWKEENMMMKKLRGIFGEL